MSGIGSSRCDWRSIASRAEASEMATAASAHGRKPIVSWATSLHGPGPTTYSRRSSRAGARRCALRRSVLTALRQRRQHLSDQATGGGASSLDSRRGCRACNTQTSRNCRCTHAARGPDWPESRWVAASFLTFPATCDGFSGRIRTSVRVQPGVVLGAVERTPAAVWAVVRTRPGDGSGDHDGERDRDRCVGQPLAAVRLGTSPRREPASGLERTAR